MKQIVEIKNNPYQSFTIVQENGEEFTLVLRYLPSQQIWLAEVNKNSFNINGLKLTISPNLLYQWSNIINFGLACYSDQLCDPFHINDFITKRVILFLLTEEEVRVLNG